MKVRQVLVVGTLLVSTAFVFGSDEQPNNGNLRPRRRRLQREACILVQQAKDFRDGSDKTEWECELQGADRKRGEGRFVKVEGLSDSQLERSEAKSGRTSVQVENALVTEGKLLIPAGAQPEFASVQPRGPKNNHKNGKEGNSGATEEATDVGNSTNDNVFDYRRELLSGDRTVLAIRVTANDKKTSFSQKRLSNKIFGSRGDAINLSERFDTCSYGQVTMSPYSGTTFKGTTIPDTARVGVVTIDINKNVGGSKDGDIRDAVLDAAEAQLGNLERQFDHVMLCLPPGTEGYWIAYAYINHWLSVFNDDWCTYPSATMHELGHNLNLYHSAEGNEQYGDQTGMMGYSYSDNDTAMCFNPAKNWQLGWYKSRRKNVNLITQGAFSGTLIGIDNYEHPNAGTNAKVLIKLNAGRTNYFIGFNLKEGMNRDTKEGAATVTITQAQLRGDISELLGKQEANTDYKVSNYKSSGQDAIIKIGAIEMGADPPYAEISMYLQ